MRLPVGTILYHGTAWTHFESIRTHGLLPPTPRRGVYLTPDMRFAVQMAYSHGCDALLWMVDASELVPRWREPVAGAYVVRHVPPDRLVDYARYTRR